MASLCLSGTSSITDHEYNSDGRLTRIVTDGQAVNYAYDDLGRTTRVFTGDDSSPRSETLYSYDGLGRLATVTATRRFSQDIAAAETTSYTYDLVGNLDAVSLPGGVATDYVYDAVNRLERLVQHGPGEVDGAPADSDITNNEILASYDYLLRVDGRRLGVVELADGGTPGTNTDLITTRYAWQYDSLNRLIEEAYDGLGTADDYITRFSYDDAGNRVLLEQDATPASAFGTDAYGFLTIDPAAFAADSTTTSVYDANDRLLSEATDEDSDAVIDEFIQYDYAGTVQAAKTVHDGADATAPISERTTYDYNAHGRQSKVEIDSDGDSTVDVTTEYTYNDAGIRIKQIVTRAGQASTTEFVIDASNPTGYAQSIDEVTDGSVTKTYTLGLDVISQAINDSGLTGTLRTLLYDGHGSVRQLVDEVGQVVKAALDSLGGPEVLKLDYTAYGQAINFAAATAVSSLLYSGEFTDATTGQQYLRARFYDPATGRFNRVDPFAGAFSEPQSLHKYLYGHGDPITHVDPNGQIATWVVSMLSGAVAGAVAVGGAMAGVTGVFGGTGNQILRSFTNGLLAGSILGAGIGLSMTPGIRVFSGKKSQLLLMSVLAEGALAGMMFVIMDAAVDAIRSIPLGAVPSAGKYAESFSRGFATGVASDVIDQFDITKVFSPAARFKRLNTILDIFGAPTLELGLDIVNDLFTSSPLDFDKYIANFAIGVSIAAVTRRESAEAVVSYAQKIGFPIDDLDRATSAIEKSGILLSLVFGIGVGANR